MPTNRAFLYEYIGNKTKMLDSTRTSKPGHFQFSLSEKAHPGLYRIVVGPNNFWDFIFNYENVSMKTHFSAPLDSLEIIESAENILLMRYMNYYIDLSRKAEGIRKVMALYDKDSEVYKSMEKELLSLGMGDPQKISKEIIKNNPDTYTARFLKAELNPVVPVGLDKDEELQYVIDHFFDNVDFSDSALIYSPPLITKAQSYFRLIGQAYPPAESEARMMKGLDRLMSLAAISDPVFDFIISDIADLYEKSEYETFFAYLTENYLLEAGCTDEERSTELSEVLASIKKTALGKKAPEMIIPLSDGPVILSDIPEKYVLVFFWASWCPGCKEMLPALKDIYNIYHPEGFEVVAISIDKDKSEYNMALSKGQYKWINYSELKGWDCSIAYDYGIRATPTMVLLDEERKVISKPRNPGMLIDALRKAGL